MVVGFGPGAIRMAYCLILAGSYEEGDVYHLRNDLTTTIKVDFLGLINSAGSPTYFEH